MNILNSIIRLYEIKKEMEARSIPCNHLETLTEEFDSLKISILSSNFAFDNVKQLLTEVETKIRPTT
jgi:hypothetical protein